MSEIFYPEGRDLPLLPRPNVNRPSSSIPTGETLPVVDENGIVVARSPRSYVHGGALLLHPVVHLHLVDRMGRIYLQRRSLDKDLLPGYWDTAVGGHVLFGEMIVETLFREASEEIGLYDFNPIHMETYVWEGQSERELVFSFAAVGDRSPVPDGTEVIGGRWWTMSEIEESFAKNILTPNFEAEIARLAPRLQALL